MLASRRVFSSVAPKKSVSALSVFKDSCYHKIDFKIHEEATVNDAVRRFAAFNIGCLAVTDAQDSVVGVISERDYINKVSALGKDDKAVMVKDVCTYTPNLILAKKSDSLDQCMNKMLVKDIRHLLVFDDNQRECLGLISIKDLVKEVMKNKDDIITRLTDFKMGKGAYFGSE
jgi:predicted transcriptional regulator